jgi:DNA-binding transcriptional ArsR family regulator
VLLVSPTLVIPPELEKDIVTVHFPLPNQHERELQIAHYHTVFLSEIEHQLRMPQPSVSKHLRVLRKAGFVEARVDAQRRVYRIRPEPLMAVDAWLAPFRRFWSAHIDALERHLDHLE